MTSAEVIQLITLAVVFISGIGVPFTLARMRHQDTDRAAMKQELHERLDHLDQCLDDTKRIVLGQVVTKVDFSSYKLEVQETITRIREAVSREQHGLHERLMRLETKLIGASRE